MKNKSYRYGLTNKTVSISNKNLTKTGMELAWTTAISVEELIIEVKGGGGPML